MKNFQLAKKVFDEKVKTYVHRSFDKAQEYDVDVFGFGQEIARTNPGKWEKIKNHWES